MSTWPITTQWSLLHETTHTHLLLSYFTVCVCVCAGCRWRRRLLWSCVSKICLWGACPRSPASAPVSWSSAVNDWWNSVTPSCRASTSVCLTSTLSCRTETCVSPGTGRAELRDMVPSCRVPRQSKCWKFNIIQPANGPIRQDRLLDSRWSQQI